MDARPLIALTTDFGTREPFVGLMKAQIHARCPSARIVDLTHELPPFRPAAGAFWLEKARHWCPPGTVHVAVVDPGVGTARRLLAARAGGQYWFGPDNGLLAACFGAHAVVHAIDLARLSDFGLAAPSATFHGRDVFAPLAAEVAAGRLELAALGPTVSDWVASALPAPVGDAGRRRGEVLLFDRYGNAFTNLEARELEVLERPVVVAGGRRLAVVRTYGDAAPGAAVALVNAFGVVEVAVVQGDASRSLELRAGDPVWLEEGVGAGPRAA